MVLYEYVYGVPVLRALCSGVLVPGGFGLRGIEGKVLACNWARVNRKPFLGARVLDAFSLLSTALCLLSTLVLARIDLPSPT